MRLIVSTMVRPAILLQRSTPWSPELNDAPRPTQPLYAANAIQDIALDLALPEDLFIDVDSTDVQWSLRAGDNAVPSWLAFDPRTLTVRGTPRNRDVGTYSLLLVSRDSQGAEGQMPFQLTVENVNDPPTSIRLVRSQVSESVPGLRIGALQVVDPDPADQFTWQISDPRFVVLDNELWLSTTSSLDFELESSIVIQATVTDNGSPNLSLTSPLTIEVIDVNEFFPELQSQTLTIPTASQAQPSSPPTTPSIVTPGKPFAIVCPPEISPPCDWMR